MVLQSLLDIDDSSYPYMLDMTAELVRKKSPSALAFDEAESLCNCLAGCAYSRRVRSYVPDRPSKQCCSKGKRCCRRKSIGQNVADITLRHIRGT